jgi:hypothetical protein
MDWIIPIYYLIGILYVVKWAVKTIKVQQDAFFEILPPGNPKYDATTHRLGILLVFVILLGFGCLIPLSENLREPRYADTDPIETLESNRLLIEDAGVKFDDVSKLLQNPGTSIFIGRSLYPRYYKANQGEASFGFDSYVAMNFPRTVF